MAISSIASRTPANARAAAEQNGIDRVYDSWPELLADPEVEIVDIAYPPDAQLEIVRAACEAPQVRGILAQKPIAATLADALEKADRGSPKALAKVEVLLSRVFAQYISDMRRPRASWPAGGR